MRHKAWLVSGYLLAAACRPGGRVESKPYPAPSSTNVSVEQVTTISRPAGGLNSFVPAVPGSGDGGECEVSGRTERRGALYVLSFPESDGVGRNVSVEFDSVWQPIHYSDLRGDLRRVKTGPQTSVLLDFRDGTAQALNEWPGRIGEMAEGELSAALEARNLGYPQRMIDLVRNRCVKP